MKIALRKRYAIRAKGRLSEKEIDVTLTSIPFGKGELEETT